MIRPFSIAAQRILRCSAMPLARYLCMLAIGGFLCFASYNVAAQGVAVVVTHPQQGETVHDNTGEVPVAITVQGGAFAADHRVRVLLDGKPYGAELRTPSFVLQGIERGEHKLQVQLVDAKGAVVATSASVTFYLWQASSQFPVHKRDTPAPR